MWECQRGRGKPTLAWVIRCDGTARARSDRFTLCEKQSSAADVVARGDGPQAAAVLATPRPTHHHVVYALTNLRPGAVLEGLCGLGVGPKELAPRMASPCIPEGMAKSFFGNTRGELHDLQVCSSKATAVLAGERPCGPARAVCAVVWIQVHGAFAASCSGVQAPWALS